MEMKIVPQRATIQNPKCEKCGTPYAPPTSKFMVNDWTAQCNCHEPNSFNSPNIGDKFFRIWGPQADEVGKTRHTFCVVCNQALDPNSQAMFGTFPPYQYIGYAHLDCYNRVNGSVEQAKQEMEAAENGISISVWFAASAKIKTSPNTGHYDGNSRFVPEDFPNLPEGSVILDMYHAPFCAIKIMIPAKGDAEKLWLSAQIENAGWEMHWFECGATNASRSWSGYMFGSAISEAQEMEMSAGTI